MAFGELMIWNRIDTLFRVQGGLCATGKPLFSNKYLLDPNELSFFRDDGSENSGGLVTRIRVWEKALTDVEMATESGCTLAYKPKS